MKLEIKVPDSAGNEDVYEWHCWLQEMTNRWVQGHFRYVKPSRRKLYARRAKMELENYEKEGCREQLLNVSVYGYLEAAAPRHPNFHHDAKKESVTRGKI